MRAMPMSSQSLWEPMLLRCCLVLNLHCKCRSTRLPSNTHHMARNRTTVCKEHRHQQTLPRCCLVMRAMPMSYQQPLEPMRLRCCLALNLHCKCRSTRLPSNTHHMARNRTTVCREHMHQQTLPRCCLVTKAMPVPYQSPCCLVLNLHCKCRSTQLPSNTHHVARNRTTVCTEHRHQQTLLRCCLVMKAMPMPYLSPWEPTLLRCCLVLNLHCKCRSTRLPSSTHHMARNRTI